MERGSVAGVVVAGAALVALAWLLRRPRATGDAVGTPPYHLPQPPTSGVPSSGVPSPISRMLPPPMVRPPVPPPSGPPRLFGVIR